MSNYDAEINSAYTSFFAAGASITIIKAVSAGFDPITETKTYPTAVLETDITADDTLIVLQSLSQAFPDSGVIRIDDEEILYVQVGEALICERGDNSTVTTAHQAGAVISLLAEAWLTYAVSKGYKESLIDGSLIQVGDKQMLIPAKDFPFVLDQTCKIRQSGTLWSIINIESLSPGNDAILYKVQVRQ